MMTGCTVRLTGMGTFEDLRSSILALTFGEMVKLATPVLKRYHSDLFHDATTLEQYVTGPLKFTFSFDDYGTFLWLGEDTPDYVCRVNRYNCEIRCDDRVRPGYGDWFFDYMQVEP